MGWFKGLSTELTPGKKSNRLFPREPISGDLKFSLSEFNDRKTPTIADHIAQFCYRSPIVN